MTSPVARVARPAVIRPRIGGDNDVRPATQALGLSYA